MIRKLALMTIAAVAVLALATGPVGASTEGEALPDHDWAHDGPFGTFDRAALRRGFQVYREVCGFCHGLKYIAFRDLAALGFSDDEIESIAAEFEIADGPDDEGEMFTRPGVASDRLPDPFPNDNAARFANMGALPPDLSLIVEARPGFENYLYGLLMGFAEPPEDFELADGMSYNLYFPGKQIAMASPLFEDSVEYADGTAATVEQMAEDVTVFLAWAAEPNMEERKRLGFKVMIYLLILTVLMYFVNKKVWKGLKD